MTAFRKIPATIITGFLGAGKTTLLSKLIERADGKQIALIVNEFGDAGFDGKRLAECGVPGCEADEVIELTNGCICCTVADDFLPAMEKILKRSPAPDHIIIETSGLALPQPLVQAFHWPAVKSRVTVDGVVTVTDAAALAEGRIAGDLEAVNQQRAADPSLDHDDPIEELFEDQLRCADLVVLSKTDLIDEAGRERVRNRIMAETRPAVRVIPAIHGDIPIGVLLGLEAAAEDDMDGRHDHHHDHDEPHDHDEFESFVAAAPVTSSMADLKLRVEKAMAVDGVLRIKGLSAIEGKSALAVVQAVGPRVDTYFAVNGADSPGLVVIGLHDMDQAAVADALRGEG